ncbi:MAG: hypothetical protein IH867_07925 [Chloroflexi bacterium]|nr:hypothetical protein [Chloroflexota bacterium]
MPHLVKPIKDVSTEVCTERLTACLDYLVEAGSGAANRAAKVQANSNWGVQMKRSFVVLPRTEFPQDIGDPGSDQSLVEVINQTANIRRMLDALSWAMSDESGLNLHHVDVCHPTTSSGKDETDLVLCRDGFPTAKFEVTDVVGNRDGNNKEATDLKKLKFIGSITKQDNNPVTPPDYRGFLVVSEELAQVITDKKRWWRSDDPPIVRYEQRESNADTLIFEVFSISGCSSQ